MDFLHLELLYRRGAVAEKEFIAFCVQRSEKFLLVFTWANVSGPPDAPGAAGRRPPYSAGLRHFVAWELPPPGRGRAHLPCHIWIRTDRPWGATNRVMRP
jgi:hypothetical protein